MSFYSDGLVEAHDPHPEMFGTPRLKSLLVQHPAGTSGITTFFLEELKRFTGLEVLCYQALAELLSGRNAARTQ